MATVMYWVDCKDCPTKDLYEREKIKECPNCGGSNLTYHREWDEQDDHNG